MIENTAFEKPLIFTDLDGTLLDHNTYDFSPALPLLDYLKSTGVPVIPTTSKTKAELLQLRQTLNNHDPFIIENGAAVYVPKQALPIQPKDTQETDAFWIKTFVAPRARWQTITTQLKALYPNCFVSFSEAGVEGISAMTGLSQAEAALAAQREFGEPIQWSGSVDQRKTFIEAVNQRGGQVLVGGRFMHICGCCDKGQALLWLKNEYQRQTGTQYTAIALGDSHNDTAMLNAADHAIIVRSPNHSPPILNRDRGVFSTSECGPRGWVEGISQILSTQGVAADDMST